MVVRRPIRPSSPLRTQRSLARNDTISRAVAAASRPVVLILGRTFERLIGGVDVSTPRRPHAGAQLDVCTAGHIRRHDFVVRRLARITAPSVITASTGRSPSARPAPSTGPRRRRNPTDGDVAAIDAGVAQDVERPSRSRVVRALKRCRPMPREYRADERSLEMLTDTYL